jgi:rubrerythrin
LADLEGLYQEKAAENMGISRQTFGNIVESARRKVADVLVNGKSLHIEGGFVDLNPQMFMCADCGQRWKMPGENDKPQNCPCCGSANITTSL